MRTRLVHALLQALVATLLLAVPTAASAHPGTLVSEPSPAAPTRPGPPRDLRTTVVPGEPTIRVSWGPPNDLGLVLGYDVLVDGAVVDTVLPIRTTYDVTEGLTLGRDHEVSVRAVGAHGAGRAAETTQTLYLAPVTTVQAANPSNPLAGQEWGVYLGLQDPAYIGWSRVGLREKEEFAPIAMIHKAKFFGRWVADGDAYQKTRDYIENAQAGDPDKLTIMTIFRMFPWEGEARIDKRLPTPAEQASYRQYILGMARAIGDEKVAVVLQPDGYFAKKAFEAHVAEVGRTKALLPSRLLAWTTRTLAEQRNTTVYVDMGSEDWARGDVAPVAKFLKLCGVRYARGFSLNVSHKNYLDREIEFAKKVSHALAKMGLPGKRAVLDTVDNGQPFHGSEINPQGARTPNYTQPGEIPPCRTKTEKKPCTALGIPPTTDVDNPRWGLSTSVAATAAKYVDAYLWVSRPWLPDQGEGGTKFSPTFARLLLKTWEFSPYFVGTP